MSNFRLPDVPGVTMPAPDAGIEVTGLTQRQIDRIANAAPGTELEVLRNIRVPASLATIVTKDNQRYEVKDTKINRAIWASKKKNSKTIPFKAGPGKWAKPNYASIPNPIMLEIICQKKTPQGKEDVMIQLPAKRLQKLATEIHDTQKSRKTIEEFKKLVDKRLRSEPSFKKYLAKEKAKKQRAREEKLAKKESKKAAAKPVQEGPVAEK